MSRIFAALTTVIALLGLVGSSSVTRPSSPLRGDNFYVVPNSDAAVAEIGASPSVAAQYAKIANRSTAIWLGEWNANQTPVVNYYEQDAATKGAVPVFVLYAIPGRDCGGYSAGGYQSDGAYETFVNQIKTGISGHKAVVIVEPDALGLIYRCGLTSAQQADRVGLISYAAHTLVGRGTSVYIDAGNAYFTSVSGIAPLLRAAGVQYASGFSLNVSNFDTTSNEQAFGNAISASVGAKHFVVDTSRNGNGPADSNDTQWCNPPGRALGTPPTASTSDSLADAYLWVKYPGQSDGTCNGGPTSGVFWPSYALGLAEASP